MILLQIRCYYGNDKDDNISFCYSGDFLILLSFKDNDGNIEQFLAGWKCYNLHYFYTTDFFDLYIFCPIFAPKIMKMFSPCLTKLWFKPILYLLMQNGT